jgi:squalene-hopene/tetraprenyl-beta-curcumene cyclase
MQPDNGGFLEAVPLTAFVVMSLAAAGHADDPVVRAGVAFLGAAQRADGSWPIDSNLATWVSTLAINALATSGRLEQLALPRRQRLRRWLMRQQHLEEHPFTRAAPGGWAWTDLPGGVPDADDTAGALLALHHLGLGRDDVAPAAACGLHWLLDLQNRDGGLPTFCRGWGRLPFDRSCPDITAHGLRAMVAWREELPDSLQQRLADAMPRALRYLARAQREDGTWLPLWFGNQWLEAGANPVYGTAQVLLALQEPGLAELPEVAPMVARGRRWLIRAQNPDGGWGASADHASSLEETSLAVAALAAGDPQQLPEGAAEALLQRAADPRPSPIGLYFASLWYSERLYPLVFLIAALGRVVPCIGQGSEAASAGRQRVA